MALPWGVLCNSINLHFALLSVFVFHHRQGIKDGRGRTLKVPQAIRQKSPLRLTVHRLHHHALLHHFCLPRPRRWLGHRWPSRRP